MTFALMMGAMTLSRLAGGAADSDRLLELARRQCLAIAERPTRLTLER
jgi:hypothetical protein